MNPLPDSTFWLRALGGLALQVTVLLASAGLIAFKLRTARGQRAVWLTAVIATGLLQVAGFFGADRQLAAWFEPKPTPERVFRIRTNVPVASKSAAWLNASSDLTLTGARPELNVAPPATLPQSVWWPAWLWLAGSAVLLGRKLIWRGVFAFWWRGRQTVASPELCAHVEEIARQLGFNRRVRVIASPALVCPIAFGVLRPTVGLPGNFATAHGAREREAMLAHELAHLSARDPLWLGLTDLLAAMLWWHPLVWWARRQLRAACETAADEASVLVEDGPAVLANCLVTLAAQLPRRRAFGLLGMAGFRSDLGRRVERLLALRSRGLRPASRARLLFMTIGGTGVAVALTLSLSVWAMPRTLREQPTLLAMTQQALAAAQPATPDPTSVIASTPTSPLSDPISTRSRKDANDAPWQASLLIEPAVATDSNRKAQMAASMDALVRRLYATREFTWVKVEPVEPDRIQVFLGMKQTNGFDALKMLVEQPGELEFRRVHPASDELLRQGQCPTGYEVLDKKTGPGEAERPYVVVRVPVKGLTSREIAQAEAKVDPLDSKPRVLVTFTPKGAIAFQNLTREAIGQQIAVVVDGELLMAPLVNEEIAVGACEISGSFSMNEAGRLAALLQTPLPTRLKWVSGTVFGPSLPGGSPDARAATTPVEPAKVISIWVTAGGQILFAGRETTLEAVRGELEKAKASAPDLVVRLIADTRTPVSRVVEVLDKCREAGITRNSLHTIDTTRPATNAPPASSISPPAKSVEAKRSARVATLVQDAKLLYDLGKFDDAKKKFEEARALGPTNPAERYALRSLEEALSPSEQVDIFANKRVYFRGKSLSPQELAVELREARHQNPNFRLMAVFDRQTPDEFVTQILEVCRNSGAAQFAHRFRIDGESLSATTIGVGTPAVTDALIPTNPFQPVRSESVNPGSRGGGGFGGGGGTTPGQTAGTPVGQFAATNGADTSQLLTRVFKLNPNTFQQGLSAVAGNVPTNQPPVQLLRSFFAAVGLDFGGANSFVGGTNANAFQSPAGKAVFYNDRNGMLLVRATRRDLDAVETALQMLNATPPQVVIEAKFVEITQDDSKALGFDWYLGNFVMGTNGSTNPTAGTAPSFSGAPSTANPQGVFPGPVAALRGSATNRGTLTGLMTDPQFRSVVEALQRGGTNGVHDLRGDELDWPGRQATNAHNVRVTAALGATVTGVLTDPQYRVVLRALEQRSGAEVLSAPRVTTLSGRQAQIQVVDMRTAVTGIDPSALIQNGAQPKTNAVPFLTSTFPVGPTLDVIPTVAADGYTIELNLVASITEFLGYDQPPADAKVTVWEGGKASEVAMPLPRFRVRQMTTKAVLWDGQTLVLAGMPVEDSVTMKDKVPVLGDLPAVGSLFRSESKSTRKKNLLVFITATIIDPAGNRVHSADNPPYDPNKIPPQSPR